MKHTDCQAYREYVIWGIPRGKVEEEPLYTLAESMGEAVKVQGILAAEYGARAMRIQVIDFSEPIDFTKTISSH